MTLGFVGAGAIASAMVTGLRSDGGPRHTIRLSPRNAAVGANLASQFDNVAVCASNQQVVDASDTVVLAVRPQVAEEVLSGLHFSSDQVVISLVAGFSVRRISNFVMPAKKIWRAVPLPSVARRRGPIAVFPPGGVVGELLAPLGQVFEVDTEDHLNVFSTATSTIAAHFRFLVCVASWVAQKGIPEHEAAEYVALMFGGLSDPFGISRRSLQDLATAHTTAGGLNEQVLRDLSDHGVFDSLTHALDSVYRRIGGQSA